MKKHINGFLFADQLEKPNDLIKYRSRKCRGLNLHNIDCKFEAMLIKTFLEMSIGSQFRLLPYFTAIYNQFVLDDPSISIAKLPPFFNSDMIETIKSARSEDLKVEGMDSKAWYSHLLNQRVLSDLVEQPDSTFKLEERKCKGESSRPDLDWPDIWRKACMSGLSNNLHSFLFRFLLNILTTQERLHRITRTTPSNVCVRCDSGLIDNAWSHTFLACTHTAPFMEWLRSALLQIDQETTIEKIIWLQISVPNEATEVAAVWLIAETMAFAWARRKSRAIICLHSFAAHLDHELSILLRTERHHNAGVILQDLIASNHI